MTNKKLSYKNRIQKPTLNGHSTHRTYGKFHSNAITTTYATITPSVTPCVWLTLNPRFAT